MKIKFKFIFILILILLPLLFFSLFLLKINLNEIFYKNINNNNNNLDNIFIYNEKDYEDYINYKKQDNFKTLLNIDKFNIYIIKWGDTLLKIKRKFKLSNSEYKKLIEINNIKNENLIISGQKLKIPQK
ncbi:MAG: LysM peptidoglycan-binding domain-containing protein [Spirochaetes bacterium]|nr:LysM peptidoglycan-binding domain-containing protein [Spirochaetota bacterium]